MLKKLLCIVNNAGLITLDLHPQISALKGTVVNKIKVPLWGGHASAVPSNSFHPACIGTIFKTR